MIPTTRQSALEPGVLRVLQVSTLIQVIGLFILRRPTGLSLGIEVPFGRWLAVTLSGPLVLLVYTWVPWWRRRLGRAFLPLALVIGAANIILDKYLTLAWLVQPAQRELDLLLLVRLWFIFQLITVLVAWQYTGGWVLLTALLLSFADGALSVPFMRADSPLYRVLLFLFAGRTFSVTTIALGVSWLMQRQRAQQHALALANRKLAQYAATTEHLAVSQERNRLARELHDTLAHSLSGVAVQLEAVQALWEVDPHAARAMLDQACRNTRNGLTEARRALHALRAQPLEDMGLALAISTFAESLAARAGLTLDLDVHTDLDQLAPDVEQCVYRVAQEALSNVARHADARSLQVALAHADGHITLTVADDGHGFEPAAVHGAHYGLQGLRERAEMIGGTLEVNSQPAHGTIVRLAIQG